MVSTFFGQTGDLKLSREMAGTRILGSWGRSTINGTPQAMKFSPESVTGLKSDQLRKELDSQIAANTFKTLPTGEAGPMDPKNVIITSDNRTGKDHKYALQYIRPDGMIDNLYTPDGKRAYWNPMPERSAEAQAQIDKIDEKARARQADFKESQIGD
jgi:hypothetical protein